MDSRKTTDTAATVIIGQKVRPGSEQDFEAWQRGMNREASKYPGFLAAEINPPTAVQPDWVVVYRFDSVAHVQAWITSSNRQGLLEQARPYFDAPRTPQVVGGGPLPSHPPMPSVVPTRVPPSHPPT